MMTIEWMSSAWRVRASLRHRRRVFFLPRLVRKAIQGNPTALRECLPVPTKRNKKGLQQGPPTTQITKHAARGPTKW
jgi:hypothetical protein